ncbi:hypothetical protein PR202_gb04585 [Eleusine coracana subsp. coracana]|uniref:Uncharacterized protein n=1 Tax=Eleusine coracana subsp. coracana TaxID=191504 RepID=A0AAV5E4Q7_ELECO|nr:hypothetical protein PR202_gb04585 [Eleusine coracana subsp. coracana]
MYLYASLVDAQAPSPMLLYTTFWLMRESPEANQTWCLQHHHMESPEALLLDIASPIARDERILNIAYNVVNGLCTPIPNQSALVYITIDYGGNQEGLATK